MTKEYDKSTAQHAYIKIMNKAHFDLPARSGFYDLEAGAAAMRTTKLWPEFAAQAWAKTESYTSRPFPKAAAWLNWSRAVDREPGVSAGSRAGVSAGSREPGVSAGSVAWRQGQWQQGGWSWQGGGSWQRGQ